jgi:hypothetical protein
MLRESNPDWHGLRVAISAAINSPFRYQFAVSPSCNEDLRNSFRFSEPRVSMMPRSDDPDSVPSEAAPAPLDRVEYIVRPSDDEWLIEHDGDRYGPYKNSREAMFFAIDAARKLGALGKNTYVKMTDHAGHPLTTWNYGVDRYPVIF